MRKCNKGFETGRVIWRKEIWQQDSGQEDMEYIYKGCRGEVEWKGVKLEFWMPPHSDPIGPRALVSFDVVPGFRDDKERQKIKGHAWKADNVHEINL